MDDIIDGGLALMNASYYENLKFAKEMAQIYGANHPKYLKAQEACNKIIEDRIKRYGK